MRTGQPLCFLLCVAAAAGAQTAGKDLETLQGTWQLVGTETRGKKIAAADIEKLAITLRFEKDRYIERKGKKLAEEGTIQLQADKTPAQIDITIGSGRDKGKLQLGIYKLEGDTLTFAIAPAASKNRPTAFTTQFTSEHNVQVFKRVR